MPIVCLQENFFEIVAYLYYMATKLLNQIYGLRAGKITNGSNNTLSRKECIRKEYTQLNVTYHENGNLLFQSIKIILEQSIPFQNRKAL